MDKTWGDLEDCELVPFRRAVADGIEAVMTAHVIIGAQGERVPVTLHAPSLAILRKRLAYDGVIISDCLEMDAIKTESGGTVEGAVKALGAGCDSVMVCHTFELQTGALENVFQAVKKSRIPREKIGKSAERIRKLKGSFLDWNNQLEQSLTSQLDAINKRSEELAKSVYARSATVVRSANGVLPLRSGQKVIKPVVMSSPLFLRLSGDKIGVVMGQLIRSADCELRILLLSR